MIDLHTHTNYSDGTQSPEELLQLAKINGVSKLAITDHDCIDGYVIAKPVAKEIGIELISGVEISTHWRGEEIHILGLNFDITHSGLLVALQNQCDKRHARAKLISEKCESLELHQAYEKIIEKFHMPAIGRLHFAKLLMEHGFGSGIGQVFKHYLKPNKPCYVPVEWMSLSAAINLINQAGGSAVLAHPARYGLGNKDQCELIAEFKAAGGEGIEVVSGNSDKKTIKRMARLANYYDLMASRGSDFHDPRFSPVKLGGEFALPDSCKPIWEKWEVEHDEPVLLHS